MGVRNNRLFGIPDPDLSVHRKPPPLAAEPNNLFANRKTAEIYFFSLNLHYDEDEIIFDSPGFSQITLLHRQEITCLNQKNENEKKM